MEKGFETLVFLDCTRSAAKQTLSKKNHLNMYVFLSTESSLLPFCYAVRSKTDLGHIFNRLKVCFAKDVL